MEHRPTREVPPRPIGLPGDDGAGPAPAHRSVGHWPELDLLRGLACFLMILNHVAVRSPSMSTSTILSASEFVGGFAPVLFFFTTGLGYGVQSLKPGGRHGFGFLTKVAVLLLADLDFFTFIGLSMLILELISRLRRGGWVASIVGVSAVLARFVAGPLLRPALEGHPWGLWVGDVIGTGGHFGYPAGPWLAFPMLGYVLGRLAESNRATLLERRRLPRELAASGAPFALLCLVMVARGSGLFRYWTMNSAYFLASLGVIATSLSVVVAAVRSARLGPITGRASLSGLRSFAVVPLHYFLLDLTIESYAPANSRTFAPTFLAVLVLSFTASALFVRLARALDHPARRAPTTAIVLVLAVTYYAVLRGTTGGLAATAIRSTFQLALCLVLSFRSRAAGRGRSGPAPDPLAASTTTA